MSFNRERVEHALNELLVRIVPEDADDSEDAANQRFNDAFDLAIDTLSAAGDPAVVPDVDHIADLIDRRGMPAIAC
jgi:gamma-tubulin complex component 3